MAIVAFCDAHDVNELHERVLAEAKVCDLYCSVIKYRVQYMYSYGSNVSHETRTGRVI